jgi:hypothetical protein
VATVAVLTVGLDVGDAVGEAIAASAVCVAVGDSSSVVRTELSGRAVSDSPTSDSGRGDVRADGFVAAAGEVSDGVSAAASACSATVGTDGATVAVGAIDVGGRDAASVGGGIC